MAILFKSWFRKKAETPEDVEKLQREAGLEQLQLAADARDIFVKNETGQRLLAMLIEQNWILQTAWDEDPGIRAYREGRRSLVLELLDLARVGPKQFARMSAFLNTEEIGHE